jgi:ADP-ribose pyrophosphatase YjhB (NUDIX family)
MKIKQVFDHYPQREKLADEFKYCPLCSTPLVKIKVGARARLSCPECGFIHHRNPAPSIGVLIADGEKVVLGRRRGHPGKGKWALPSGYIDFEEDFLTSAIREAREETGLDVEVCSIMNVVSSFVSPRFHFLCVYMFARVVGGYLRAGDDLETVDWFPLAGPLPEMGFQEDLALLEMYKLHGSDGLAIDPIFACWAIDHGHHPNG